MVIIDYDAIEKTSMMSSLDLNTKQSDVVGGVLNITSYAEYTVL